MKNRSKVVVYEKPTCSKCREVKHVLTEKGIEFESVHYLEERFSAAKLKDLLRRAGLNPGDAMRKNEPAYKEHVAGRGLSDAEWITLMVKHPELIQRPIVVRGEKVVLARPVERLEDLDIK